MLIFKNWGDVFTLVHSRHHTSSHVLRRLEFLKINLGHSSQHRVAAVKPTVNKSLLCIREWKVSLVKELLTEVGDIALEMFLER